MNNSPEPEPITDIALRTITTLTAYSGIDITLPADSTRPIADLGFDSLEMVDVVQALESEFGVTIPDYEVDRLTTVGDLVGYVEKKVATITEGGEK